MRKNKSLSIIRRKGLDNEEVWREIMLNGGSVQTEQLVRMERCF